MSPAILRSFIYNFIVFSLIYLAIGQGTKKGSDIESEDEEEDTNIAFSSLVRIPCTF